MPRSIKNFSIAIQYCIILHRSISVYENSTHGPMNFCLMRLDFTLSVRVHKGMQDEGAWWQKVDKARNGLSPIWKHVWWRWLVVLFVPNYDSILLHLQICSIESLHTLCPCLTICIYNSDNHWTWSMLIIVNVESFYLSTRAKNVSWLP